MLDRIFKSCKELKFEFCRIFDPIEEISNRDADARFKKNEIIGPWQISHSRIKFNFTTQCPIIVFFGP